MYDPAARTPPPQPPGASPSAQPAPPPAAPVPAAPPAGPPRSASPWPWLLGVAAAVGVLLVVTVGGVVGVQLLRGGQEQAAGADAAGPVPEPRPEPPAATLSPAATDEPEPPPDEPEPPADGEPVHPETGPDGPDGPVSGPTYGEGEETYLMELSGHSDLLFDFRTPPGWGCAGSGNANPDAVRWVCVYDGGTFPIVTGGPGGIIEAQPCPDTCAEQEWQELRELFPDPESPWQQIDETTMYAETDVIETDDGPRVGVRFSRLYAAGGSGEPDSHLTVRMSGHPEELTPLQKIVNELYEVTS